MIEQHKKFLGKKISLVDIKHVKSKFYRDILIKYGQWLVALLTRKVNPMTPDQYDFIETFKKSRYKKFSSLPKNKFVAALYLWKGKNWVTSIALALAYENRDQSTPIYIEQRHNTKESKSEHIATLSKCNPPSKSKHKSKYLFPKLDPNKTYRWTDQGFQTREGHKVMSSKSYRNSKSK